MSLQERRKSLILATMAIASLVAFGCGSDDSDEGDCYGKVCGSNQICDDTAKACVDKPEPESCTGLMGPDYRVCSDECTNIMTDPNNCGNCGTQCGPTQTCAGGSCQNTVTCDNGKSQCGDSCYDLTSDDNHCGSCSNACYSGQKCVDRNCEDICDDADKCGGVCVNKMADDDNCGACGNKCGDKATCREGKCESTIVCTQGQLCGSQCVDITTDSNNCGSCDHICPSGETCVNSDCVGEVVDECQDSEQASCEGNSVKECKDKQYVLSECGDNFICNDGKCIENIVEDECNEDEFVAYCEGNSIKSCKNKQFDLQDCGEKVCDGAQCVDNIDVVKCDETFVPRCDDNNAVACTNGIETPTACGSLFCYQGECRDDIDCDSENFTPQCDGDTAVLTCTDNIKGKTDCGTNQLCISGECKDLPDDLCPFDEDKKAPGVCGCGIPDADLDGNGIIDCVESGVDLCPDDSAKTTPGICGCNIPDTMVNGTPKCLSGAENMNDVDLCPKDPNKNLPGVCGCGLADTIDPLTRLPQCIVKNKLKEQISFCGNAKTEKYLPGVCGCDVEDEIDSSTGVPKCLADGFDLCPDDASKTDPGLCGCGVVDDAKDKDGDGTPDCLDQCPESKFKTVVDSCGCDKLSYNLDGNTICALPIETAEEFLDFKTRINNNTLANTSGLAAVLLNDITINSTDKWTGFNNYLGKFVSTGKTISGTLDCQGGNNCALFTGLNGGRIHNVNVDLDVKGGNNTALLVATASGATISKVKAKGTVNGISTVAGVVATSTGATLLDVTADVTVTGTLNFVAGVVAAVNSNSTLTNVSHTGKITTAGYYVGGVLGYVKDSKLTNLSHNGDIEAQHEQVGGIAGRITGTTTATQLNATGNITVAVSGRHSIGGVVGYMDGESSVSKASSTGSINSQSQQTGGIVGRLYGSARLNDASSNAIINSTANNTGGIAGYISNTSAIDKAEFTGKVTGQSNTGGIVGYMEGATTSITNADVDAEIVGTNSTGGILGASHANINEMAIKDVTVAGSVKGNMYVGGIAGYARVELSNATNDATVDGIRLVGGIVGEYGSGSLSNVTNNGAVTATNDANTNVYAAGICGNLIGGKAHTGLTNTGNVAVTSTKGAAYGSFTGGIFGNITNTEHGTSLTTVKNSGSVNSIGEYIGGIVGYANTTALKGVENSGDVTGGTEVSTGGVGGIVGQLYFNGLPADKGIEYQLEDLKNSGAVSGGNRVGGVIGHLLANGVGANVTLKNVVSSGNVTATKDSSGGIVGRLIHNGNATLINVNSTGNVTSTASYVGGLVGALPASNDGNFGSLGARTISTTIDRSSASGTIKGNLNIGGLVGYINTDFANHNYDKDIAVTCPNDSALSKTYNRWHYFDGTNNIVIRNSYSSGSVDANNQAGGLVGFIEGTSSEKSYTNAVYKFENESESNPCNWVSSNLAEDGAVDKINSIGKVIIANTYSSSQVKGVNKEFGGLIGKINYTNKLAASNNYMIHNVYTTGIVDESGAGVISTKPSAADFSKVYSWASSGPARHTLNSDVEEIVNFEYSSKVAKIDDKTLVDILNTNIAESETDDLKSDNSEKWIEKDASLDIGTKVKLAGFDF